MLHRFCSCYRPSGIARILSESINQPFRGSFIPSELLLLIFTFVHF